MTSQPETGTPARSLPPVPDEALPVADAAFLAAGGDASGRCVDAAIAAVYPILARAVLEWAADELAATAQRRGYSPEQQAGGWGALRLRRLAREVITERTQP